MVTIQTMLRTVMHRARALLTLRAACTKVFRNFDIDVHYMYMVLRIIFAEGPCLFIISTFSLKNNKDTVINKHLNT